MELVSYPKETKSGQAINYLKYVYMKLIVKTANLKTCDQFKIIFKLK